VCSNSKPHGVMGWGSTPSIFLAGLAAHPWGPHACSSHPNGVAGSARAPLFGLVALANLRRRCHATDSERVQDVFLKIFDQTFPPMALSLLWYRSKVT